MPKYCKILFVDQFLLIYAVWLNYSNEFRQQDVSDNIGKCPETFGPVFPGFKSAIPKICYSDLGHKTLVLFSRRSCATLNKPNTELSGFIRKKTKKNGTGGDLNPGHRCGCSQLCRLSHGSTR